MTTTLTNAERQILLGILTDAQRLAAEAEALRSCPSSSYTGYRRLQHFRRLAEANGALTEGVRVDPASWLKEEPTPAVRQAGRRALARLEAAGLIERGAPAGSKLTHAKLTAAGLAVAKEAAHAAAHP